VGPKVVSAQPIHACDRPDQHRGISLSLHLIQLLRLHRFRALYEKETELELDVHSDMTFIVGAVEGKLVSASDT
jgi:hypothetical protein